MRRGISATSLIEAPAPASRAVRLSAVVETAETAIIGTGGATQYRGGLLKITRQEQGCSDAFGCSEFTGSLLVLALVQKSLALLVGRKPQVCPFEGFCYRR